MDAASVVALRPPNTLSVQVNRMRRLGVEAVDQVSNLVLGT